MDAPLTGLKDVSLGSSFKQWHYTTGKVTLSPQDLIHSVCFDTGYGPTLIDRQHLASQHYRGEIQRLPEPLELGGIGGNKHATNEVLRTPVYFESWRRGKRIMARHVGLVFVVAVDLAPRSLHSATPAD